MTPRRRKSHRSRQQRIGFESLESRQVLTAGFADVGPAIWTGDAGAESTDIVADSWVAFDGWYDDSWWVDDGAWVDDTWWNDEGSWSNDDWWVTADWSGDDSTVGVDVATAVVDGVVDDESGLQTGITVDAGSTVTGGEGGSEWNAFAPEATPGPDGASALETLVVSLEPEDVSAESFTPTEPSSEPVTDVLWGTVSEGLTDVTVAAETTETSASDQDASAIDPPPYEMIREGNDPAPAALDDVAAAEWDEPVLMVDEPVLMVDEPVLMVDEPVFMVDEPVAVVDEPMTVVDEPMTVVDEPMTVVDEPMTVVYEPMTVVYEPMTVVAPTAVPPLPPVATTQGLAGRSTSWFGMFMQGFGGFSASSDAASLSDSEIPGRGRRGRLPFRPAN
jgi:hypothetical protein